MVNDGFTCTKFLAGNKRLVSSAKWWTTDFENILCRSLHKEEGAKNRMLNLLEHHK